MDRYVSPRQAKVDELKERLDRLTPADVQWLISELEQADWHLEELKDRIDFSGSLMHNSFAAGAIGYDRWSRRTPEGPVIAHPDQAWHNRQT
jgi:hypothetical protein